MDLSKRIDSRYAGWRSWPQSDAQQGRKRRGALRSPSLEGSNIWQGEVCSPSPQRRKRRERKHAAVLVSDCGVEQLIAATSSEQGFLNQWVAVRTYLEFGSASVALPEVA